jgi:hypothetical protein
MIALKSLLFLSLPTGDDASGGKWRSSAVSEHYPAKWNHLTGMILPQS